MSKLPYRPEIDGLRAVAVLAVVFFHADLGFTGGYVGVDVFFVISGFLITAIIFPNIESGRFSVAEFWARRIRRLFPALMVMVWACLIAAFFAFLPYSYAQIARSAAMQAVMLANVYFWNSSGYFEPEAEMQPLLHTWSLATEEQFYVVFPLVLLMLFARFDSRNVRRILVGICIGSLGLSAFQAFAQPSAAFFLLPSRMWEMLLGALVALYPQFAPTTRTWKEVTGWLGIGMILSACWFFDSETAFPGFAALLPCLGTALFIYGCMGKLTTAGRILAWRPFVFIGVISYSFYLWHWPVLVFAQQMLLLPPNAGVRLLLVGVSMMLAFISWKFVEQPFRNAAFPGNWRGVFAIAMAMTTVLLGCCALVVLKDGFPSRLSPEVALLASADTKTRYGKELETTPEQVREGKLKVLGERTAKSQPPSFLLWGDSHAMAIAGTIADLAAEHGVFGYAATRPATVPLLDTWRLSDEEARSFNRKVLEFIKKNKIKTVFLVARWRINIEGSPDGGFQTLITTSSSNQQNQLTPDTARRSFQLSLQKTLQALEEAGVHVVIIKQPPVQRFHVPQTLLKALRNGIGADTLGIDLAEHRQRQSWVNTQLDAANRNTVSVLDPAPYLFNEEGYSLLMVDGRPVYRDDNHLSEVGAALLRPMLAPIFEKLGAHPELE